jgi:hypothetical protein
MVCSCEIPGALHGKRNSHCVDNGAFGFCSLWIMVSITVSRMGTTVGIASGWWFGAQQFKNDKIEEPLNYLGGARLVQKKKINGVDCWSISSVVDYVKAAVDKVEEGLRKKRWKLPTKVSTTPMALAFVPELDGTPELEPEDIQYFQELIGMLRWATKIGRVDILLHEISILSQYQEASAPA